MFDLKKDPNYHVGHPEARHLPTGNTLVLCPQGHVIATVRKADWTGSRWAARVKNPSYTVECAGLPRPGS